MIDPPGAYTDELLTSRTSLAVEMLLTSGVVDQLYREGRTPKQVVDMTVAYAFSVVLCGVDGPRSLHDPALNDAIRRGLREYPDTIARAASDAAATAFREMGIAA